MYPNDIGRRDPYASTGPSLPYDLPPPRPPRRRRAGPGRAVAVFALAAIVVLIAFPWAGAKLLQLAAWLGR